MAPQTTMKPPPNKPAPGDTQVIDLQDVELLVAQAAQEHQRSLPPPLPPEVRASHVPPEAPRSASLPPGHAPSMAPAPAGRSSAFYVAAVLAFLVVGIGGGLLVAMKMRRPPAATTSSAPTTSGQAAVITIPTVEMIDEADSGK